MGLVLAMIAKAIGAFFWKCMMILSTAFYQEHVAGLSVAYKAVAAV